MGTGLAFDGTSLLVSCNYNNAIAAVSPDDGHRVGTYTITGMSAIGALAWDRGRNRLWACEGFGGNDHNVWLIDLATSTATFMFTSGGCVDGLGYDGTDDTLWTSADVSTIVNHYRPDGTLISANDVSGKIGACGSSGIAVGGAYLFLANNGCQQIFAVSKDFTQSALFGTYPARLEDLECDDKTFAAQGKAAIWSKDAYDNVLNAFEANVGDCGFGGYGAAPPAIHSGPSRRSAPATRRSATTPSATRAARSTALPATSGTSSRTWPSPGAARRSICDARTTPWPPPATGPSATGGHRATP